MDQKCKKCGMMCEGAICPACKTESGEGGACACGAMMECKCSCGNGESMCTCEPMQGEDSAQM